MCTLEKRGRVYFLTLTGDGEHRLNPGLLDAIRAALARVRSDASSSADGGGSAALVTTAEGKFFSNGLDLAWARSSPYERIPLLSSLLQRTISDLMSLPMPTIAAVTGHAAAAGCALVMSHDFVVMRGDLGFLYMCELDIGVPFAGYFMALLQCKIPNARDRRDVVLRASKITAAEAVRMGIVDRALTGPGETLEEAVRLGEELAARNWEGDVYASSRRGVFVDVCRHGVLPEEEEARKVFASKL